MKKVLWALFMSLVFLKLLAFPAYAQLKQPSSSNVQFNAVVEKVIESSEIIEESGNKHPYQKLQIMGTEGKLKGKEIIIENGKYDQSGVITYSQGDNVVISVEKDDTGNSRYTITDYVRTAPLLTLFLIFVILAIIVGGKRGLSSLIGMVVTFAILFAYVLPQISSGANPVTVIVVSSLFLVPITFILSHGFSRKTFCAILGTFIALLITGVLAGYFVGNSHLSGFATDEASYINVLMKGRIDMVGLLLGGIIIGLLGVLQDITISQAAVVYQLKNANNDLRFIDLFLRAMDVGRDHIASMSNTLILVYAGVSLPLLLLFTNNPLPFFSVVNFEIIAEEIVRTLIASIGLILAVPITTSLTALLVEFTWKKPSKN